jgi:CRP/FNR family cyclic AMP-dependent transcriptional regulator
VKATRFSTGNFGMALTMSEHKHARGASDALDESMAATIVALQKGQALFTQGDPADALFYIREGKVKITVVSEHGKEAVVAILEPGSFCGEGCLAGQTLRMASAVAMVNCVAARVDKEVANKKIHTEETFAKMFTAHLLARNIRVESDLVDQLFNSTEKRLARLLVLLATYGKEGRSEPIVPAISQEMLAEMIGTSRSRVSIFMNKFRELGLIDYDGHTTTVNSSLLGMILHEGQPG